MGYCIDRIDTDKYQAFHKEQPSVILIESNLFSAVLDHVTTLAKKTGTKVYVSKACVSNYYLGMPPEGSVPHLFNHPAPDATVTSQYRFVEGPFFEEKDAQKASLKMFGKPALVESKK
jgi:hypothetical protein